MPSPRRSTLMIPRSAQSSLSHCTTTRPGIAAGSSGTTSSSRPAAITMPPECWPRWRGRFWIRIPERAEEPDAPVGGVEAGGRQLAAERLRCRRAPGRSASVPSCLASWSTCSGGVAEHLGHLARRRAVAVGDDVGGHRGAAPPPCAGRSAGRRTGSPSRAGRRRAGRDRCPATRRAPRRGSARTGAPSSPGRRR